MTTITRQNKTNRTPIPFTTVTTRLNVPDYQGRKPIAERVYADGIVVRTYADPSTPSTYRDERHHLYLVWSLADRNARPQTRTSTTPGRAANLFRRTTNKES